MVSPYRSTSKRMKPMKYSFRLSAALIAFAVLLSARLLFGEETAADRIARLNAERIDWLEDVSFHTDYTFSRISVHSEEEAKTKEIGDGDVMASGFVFKSKDKCRLQILYRNRNASSMDKDAGSANAAEMIANNDYILTYTPQNGGGRSPSGSLNRVSDKALTGLTHSLMAIDAPVSLFIPPINALPYETPSDSDYDYAETGDGHARLTFTGSNSDNGTRYVKEVVLRIDTDPITVEESIVRTYKGEDGELLAVAAIKGYEWKNCGNFFIPERVRSYTALYDLHQRKIGLWLVSEWKSSGIEMLNSMHRDFILRLDPDVRLEGMNPSQNRGVIDIDEITGDDLCSEKEGAVPVPSESSDKPAPPKYLLAALTFLVLLAAALVVWGGVRFRRKRRERSAPPADEGADR